MEDLEEIKMNKLLILFAAIAVTILSFSLASATVNQNFNVRYGVIESNGALTTTTTSITNVSAIGFVCATSDCNSTVSQMFNNQTKNSGTSNLISVQYPTTLQNSGYGLFFYQTGYIPFEYKSTFAGSGNAPSEIVYLTKKALCITPVNQVSVTQVNDTIRVTTKISAPINNSGPLNVIPSQLSTIYSVRSALNVSVSGPVNLTDSKVILLPFSGTGTSVAVFTVTPGNYAVSVAAMAQDAKCLSTTPITQNQSFTVIPTQNQSRPITLNIVSPQNITYTTSNILLNITNTNADNIVYSRDGSANQTYTTPVNLTFTEGSHTITAYATNAEGFNATSTVSFQVSLNNQTIPLVSLNIVSPQPITYTFNNILVNITSTNATSVFYSVNNGPNITYTSPVTVFFPNGTNTLTAYGTNAQGGFASKTVNFVVSANNTNQSDTTPPGPVSGLTAIAKGKNFITWNWTNPSDSDFSQAIIYINGVNVANTSNHMYNATGLTANTTYTIRINTKDTSGNVNFMNVTNTQTTLPNTHNGGNNNDNGVTRLPTNEPNTINPRVILDEDLNQTIKLTPVKKTTVNLWFIVMLLIILCILLLILIILASLLSRDKKNNRTTRMQR